MSPHVFRYYRTPSPESDYRNYESPRRHKKYTIPDHKRKWKYDNPSIYGETVYDYQSEYTTRSYSPAPRKYYYASRHHSNSHHHQHHQQQDNYKGRHPPHVEYVSPRSEPPLKYGALPQLHFEMGPPRTFKGPHSEPRIVLLHKRYINENHAHCNCHACPEKSSKTIPTMHYDELRCPHCAAFAQPTQEEILAYPWTVQSYRPNRRSFKTESHPPQQEEHFNPSTRSVLPESAVSMSRSTLVSSKPAVDRQSVSLEDKENRSTVAPSKPFFRNDRIVTRSEITADGSYSRQSKGSFASKRQSVMSVLHENGVDEITPDDSISNVSMPVLRAQSTELIRNNRSSPKVRAETKVGGTFTRDKYFRSLANQEPQNTLPSPRPAKDTASEISRMLKGEYYDRRNGRTYAYNVNYAPRKIEGTRVPRP